MGPPRSRGVRPHAPTARTPAAWSSGGSSPTADAPSPSRRLFAEKRRRHTMMVSGMSFRFTALGALLFVAGCASNPPTRPAAKPRAARAAPTVAAAHPASPPSGEDEQADDATAPATEAAPPAAPAGPATPGT